MSIRYSRKSKQFIQKHRYSSTMATFQPSNKHLRDALIFCYHLKKSVTECHELLTQAYAEKAPSKSVISETFEQFKRGNFEMANEDHSSDEEEDS